MRKDTKEKYMTLVEFLGLVLGPSYEITLHDLSLKDNSIIAIANGHVTGRTLGGAVPSSLKSIGGAENGLKENYRVNYTTLSADKRQLRSSTLYIKEGGRTVGLLCVTFDDTKFRNISKQILGLCHPDQLLVENTFEKVETLKIEEGSDIYQTEVGQLLPVMLNQVMEKYGKPMKKLKKSEKIKVVEELYNKGGFLLKGAAEDLSALTGISVPTIYRYLKEVKGEN